MSDEPLSYLIAPTGETVAVPRGQTEALLRARYIPAGKEQISDYDAEEKYGGVGQGVKAGIEGFLGGLTGNLSELAEVKSGISTTGAIEGRAKAHGGVHLLTNLTGVAFPIIASAGSEAPAAGALRGLAGFTPPALIAKAGEAAAGFLPEAASATTAAGRLGLSIARGTASAGTEGALFGVPQIVHEAAMGDPNLTAQSAMEEVGLSGALGLGVGVSGGLLGGLLHEATGGELGAKIGAWTREAEAEQGLKVAGALKSTVRGLRKEMGQDEMIKIAQEGRDAGFLHWSDQPADVFEKTADGMKSAGAKMGDILREADTTGDAAPRPIESIMARARREVLVPAQKEMFSGRAVKELKGFLSKAEGELGMTGTAEHDLTFEQLHDLRKQVSDRIYGFNKTKFTDPDATRIGQALHDVRDILSDEIEKGLDKAALPQASKEEWLAANRSYRVARTLNKISDGAMANFGNNRIPLTSVLSGIGGAVLGGPVGGLAMAGAGYLAKRYGAGVLGAAAGGLRRFVEEDAAGTLANKTAEMIAAERASGAGAISEAAGAAAAWNRAVGRLEPLGAPVKDVAREQLHDHIAQEGTTAPEGVAALSQLQASNQRVAKRVDDYASALVTGKKVAKVMAISGLAKTPAEMTHQMEQIHQVATNPDLANEKLTANMGSLPGIAPKTAQALAVAQSRAIAHLHNSFPSAPRLAPLAPIHKPTQSDVSKYNRTREMLERPSHLLKHAANGTLTPSMVQDVAEVYPERLQQMRQAVLEKVAEHGGHIPHQSRLAMSMLFGRDMDGTMSQQALAAAQAVYQLPSARGPESQTGPGAMRSTQTGLAKLSISGRTMLPSQASESRRDRA